MTQTPTESALQNVRAEWVASTFDSDGDPQVPSNPSWNRFSDYVESYPGWSGEANVEAQTPAGAGFAADHFRGPEEHDLTIQWWMQRFFIDSSSNPNDPVGELLTHSYGTQWPCHEVLMRRTVDDGGVDGAGFREFVYGRGCRPISASVPGDPSESSPLVAEATYACERVRQYIVHQPSDGTTLTVVSTSSNDTMDITIEQEDGTSETITLNGTTSVTGSTSFTDIDAFWLSAEPEGDISIQDDSSNDLLEDPITGSNTDGVEGDRGVPLTGSGSHASAIGTDPADYLFAGTSTTYDGGALAQSPPSERIHALDLSLEVDESREPRQTTRRQAIDGGPMTVSVEPDLSGPYESAKQKYRYFTGFEGDVVYTFPDGTVTVKNAQPSDTDDVDRSGGDVANQFGLTLEGHGDPAVTATNTT